MADKIVSFRFMGGEYQFNIQLHMIRRVGGHWIGIENCSLGMRQTAIAAQKMKEVLL